MLKGDSAVVTGSANDSPGHRFKLTLTLTEPASGTICTTERQPGPGHCPIEARLAVNPVAWPG